MTLDADRDLAQKLAADIVIAYLGSGSIDPAALPALIREVRAALVDGAPGSGALTTNTTVLNALAHNRADAAMAASQATASPDRAVVSSVAPAVDIEESVTPEYIVSLEDGQKFRSLRRHLMAKYGMTPDDYRQKWNLPADYPMVAPNYAQSRSQIAKRIGLGRREPPAAVKPARPRRARAK